MLLNWLGLKELPVYIRTANDNEMLELALVENIQREDLNPIEIGILVINDCLMNAVIRKSNCPERIGKNETLLAIMLDCLNYLLTSKLH